MKIIGAKGNIKDVDDFLQIIHNFAKENNIIIQTLNADVVFGKNHIVSSVDHAIRSIERKTNTTNSLAMEILLYASGERQLKLTIPKMGVKRGDANIAFIFIKDIKKIDDVISANLVNNFLDKLSLVRNDDVLKGNIDTLRKFGIGENEIKTVTKDKYGHLILEKVALVDIIK